MNTLEEINKTEKAENKNINIFSCYHLNVGPEIEKQRKEAIETISKKTQSVLPGSNLNEFFQEGQLETTDFSNFYGLFLSIIDSLEMEDLKKEIPKDVGFDSVILNKNYFELKKDDNVIFHIAKKSIKIHDKDIKIEENDKLGRCYFLETFCSETLSTLFLATAIVYCKIKNRLKNINKILNQLEMTEITLDLSSTYKFTLDLNSEDKFTLSLSQFRERYDFCVKIANIFNIEVIDAYLDCVEEKIKQLEISDKPYIEKKLEEILEIEQIPITTKLVENRNKKNTNNPITYLLNVIFLLIIIGILVFINQQKNIPNTISNGNIINNGSIDIIK